VQHAGSEVDGRDRRTQPCDRISTMRPGSGARLGGVRLSHHASRLAAIHLDRLPEATRKRSGRPSKGRCRCGRVTGWPATGRSARVIPAGVAASTSRAARPRSRRAPRPAGCDSPRSMTSCISTIPLVAGIA
jgi:hypothetical protein